MPHPVVVTVICDGHRPDFVTDETTPHMTRLRRAGTWFADHRGIFPSATRASSASIATGSWPGSHGLRGNAVALPVVGGHEVHDAGKPEFYDAYRDHFGRLLARRSLAERVTCLNGAVLCSNVSPGAAFFHDSYGHGTLLHRELCYAPGRQPLPETIDAPPGHIGDAVLVHRFLAVLASNPPSIATLWLSEPDKTMHAFPLGSPEHLLALRTVDDHVGAVALAVDRLRDNGHDVLFLIGSDHGHESVTETNSGRAPAVRGRLQGCARKPRHCRRTTGLIRLHSFRWQLTAAPRRGRLLAWRTALGGSRHRRRGPG